MNEPDHDSVLEDGAAEATAARPPRLHARLLDTFLSPGRLGAALAERPVFWGALLVGAVLVALQTSLIPAEVWAEMQREALMERGQEMPEMGEGFSAAMRWITPIFGVLGWMIMAFLLSGVVTLILTFIMGDEGRYKQYLAVYSHAMIIPAVAGLLLVPLKISQGDPQFTINLGAFFFFLGEGYFVRLLEMLDLTQVWAWLVVAQGAHAIDPRRSFGSAATVLVILAVAMAAIFATFA